MQLAVDRRDSKYVAAYFEANCRLNSRLLAATRGLAQAFRAATLLQFLRTARLQDACPPPDSCPASPPQSKDRRLFLCRPTGLSQPRHLYFIASSRAASSPRSPEKPTSRLMDHTESSNSKLKPNLSASRRALEQKFKAHQINPTVSKFQLKYIGLSKDKIRRESPAKLQTSEDSPLRTQAPPTQLPGLLSKREVPAINLAGPRRDAGSLLESSSSPNRSLRLPRRPSRSIDFDRQLDRLIQKPADPHLTRRFKVNKASSALLPVLQESKQVDRSALGDSPVKLMRIRRSVSRKGR